MRDPFFLVTSVYKVENYSHCRFDKYYYDPADAEHEYRMTLVDSRYGYNITTQEAKALGEKIEHRS